MTSLYLEKKNNKGWKVVIEEVKCRHRVTFNSANLDDYSFGLYMPLTHNREFSYYNEFYEYYIKFYDPYGKLVKDYTLNNILASGSTKLIDKKLRKKRKPGAIIEKIISHYHLFFSISMKENNDTILNSEIKVKAYFTFERFSKILNKVKESNRLKVTINLTKQYEN